MAVHPAHIVTIVVVLLCAILTFVTLGVPWTKSSGTYVTFDAKLFELCASGGSGSSCQKWTDYLSPGSSNSYCGSSGPDNKSVLTRIQVAEAFAILGALAFIAHAAVITVWALGKTSRLWIVVPTGVTVTVFLVAALSGWGSFLGACSMSFCDQATIAGGSCGPNAGIALVIVAWVLKNICYIPLLCIRRPGEAAPVAVVYATAPAGYVAYAQPVYAAPGYAQQPYNAVPQAYVAPAQGQPAYYEPQTQVAPPMKQV